MFLACKIDRQANCDLEQFNFISMNFVASFMRKNVRLNWLEGSSEVSLQICKLREVHGNFRGLSRNQGKILSDQHLVSPHKHSLVVTMESPENIIKMLIKFWLLLISNSFNKITLQ